MAVGRAAVLVFFRVCSSEPSLIESCSSVFFACSSPLDSRPSDVVSGLEAESLENRNDGESPAMVRGLRKLVPPEPLQP